MDGKKGPLDWLKEKLLANKDKAQSRKKAGKIHYFAILLLAGTALMLLSDTWKSDASKSPAPELPAMKESGVPAEEAFKSGRSDYDKTMRAYEDYYETQLTEALNNIAGVQEVKVVVNVEATEKTILEKNITKKNQITNETDRDGGKRKIEDQSTEEQVVLIRQGDKDSPFVLETRKPEIRGVLIVAGGAENIQVKKWIIESVTRVLDVPSHKVAVMPKKTKGDS